MTIDEFMKCGTANMQIADYMNNLSSADPVPGGGGAAGLVASVAASLGSMVCNLTSGKKKYAQYQEEIEDILEKCICLRDKLIIQADEDAVVFKPLSEAYGLPKDTDKEIENRDRIMEECLYNAAMAPLAMMETIHELLIYLDRLSVIGSRLAISDVGVAAYMAKACSYSASLNVFINTKSMKNEEIKNNINEKALRLIKENDEIATRAFDEVFLSLKP